MESLGIAHPATFIAMQELVALYILKLSLAKLVLAVISLYSLMFFTDHSLHLFKLSLPDQRGHASQRHSIAKWMLFRTARNTQGQSPIPSISFYPPQCLPLSQRVQRYHDSQSKHPLSLSKLLIMNATQSSGGGMVVEWRCM